MITPLLFLLGCSLGSFVNMLVFRVATKYKLINNQKKIKLQIEKDGISGRSFCDSCGKKLSWYENVPVVSWIVQGGITRCCRRKLDWSYPLVELGTGILFVFYTLAHYDTPLMLLVGLIILVFMVFSFVFDAKYMILPDFSTGILVVAAAVYFWVGVYHNAPLLWHVLAGLMGVGFIGALWLFTKGKGMGFGDVKLAGFMGLFLGLQNLVLAFYLAFVAGAVWGIGLMLLKKMSRKSLLPFGPFLLFGTLVAWWWGDKIKLW